MICPDSDLLKERAAETIKSCLPDAADWERLVFWGDEEPDQLFWDALTQSSLFSANRLIVVRRAQLWKADIWKSISAALARPRDNAWPFFCLEVGHEKGKFKIPVHIAKLKCIEFARKQGWGWEQKGLEGPTLEKFVDNEARRAGIVFEAEARRLFLDNVIPDAGAVRNEINKLALLNKGEKISPEALAMDSGSLERDAFGALKKIERGDWRGVVEDMNSGAQASRLFFLLAVAARELRLFWQLEDGGSPWLPRDEAQLKRKLAAKLGKKGISQGFALIADAEWSVKSGARTPEQTLETFCLEITQLFAGS